MVNHGVPAATRDAMFAAAREFFAQPVAFKEQYSIQRSPHNRGYVALEGERLHLTADHKEAFNIGLEMAADHPEVVAGKPFRGVNLWPALPHWRETVLAYYDACWGLGAASTAALPTILAWMRTSSRTSWTLPSPHCACCTTRPSRSAKRAHPTAEQARTPTMATDHPCH